MIFEYTKNGVKTVNDYYEEGYVTFCYFENKNNEVVIVRMVDKCTGESTTHVFDNVNGEVFTKDYIYFVKVTDTNENILVEENTRIYNGGAHSKAYAICEDGKCKVPVLSIDYANKVMPVIKLGEFNGTVIKIDYPDGFNKDNTMVFGVRYVARPSMGQEYIVIEQKVKLYDDYIQIERSYTHYYNGELMLMKIGF